VFRFDVNAWPLLSFLKFVLVDMEPSPSCRSVDQGANDDAAARDAGERWVECALDAARRRAEAMAA